MNIEYKGTRWFKCDFHLHTIASQCFQDKDVTAVQWVDRAIEKELDCVAITDHNTNAGIDDIKLEAAGKGLIVFPAVEITCSDSKVHLLILFDLDKTSNDIRDFLVRANIRADEFGTEDAISDKSIMEITDLADNDGAIVIPAHIDDYNGLQDIGDAILKKFYRKNNVNAVQVVNNPNGNTTNLIRYAKDENLALLTFSDNPHDDTSSKHGLWGIGQDYSWIKMDEKPSLESLRQAFLLPEFRVKNKFESVDKPYTMPNIWIKSISIKNTTIADDLKVDFNPQLNTIIGGRGTGKSSILRCIRGVFNRTVDIDALSDLLSDHNDFYKKQTKDKKGILGNDSKIEIEIIRENILHKIIASSINDSLSQVIEIQKYNEQTENWEIENAVRYIDFLEFEQYSQKQIYEIAQEPNALRERIDNAIDDIGIVESEKEHIKNLFFQKSLEIRTIEQQISNKEIIQTKISDLKNRIERFQESGITKLLIKKEKFEKEKRAIENFEREITEKENLLGTLIENFSITDINYSEFDEVNIESLRSVSNVVIESINNIKIELERLKEKVVITKNIYNQSINESNWKESFDAIINDFNIKKEELAQNGIDDFANFETLTEEKNMLENKLQEINTQVEQQEHILREKKQLQNQYFNKIKEITQKRREFIGNILSREDLVKIEIKPFRDKNDFEFKLREILHREDRFEDDIEKLKELCFRGNIEQEIKKVRKIFLKIKKGENINSVVSGHFVNLVNGLNDEQLDEIELLMPEDEIEVKYKVSEKLPWKPLSTASAGQKTTAILTFILSHGDIPLILDQPEDDLDNRLVYDLIVDRLKKAKEKRQLIVVTHNANIPVNGDAEYIISMDTESEKLKVLDAGTVEKASIKKEICDVMEGSEKAFQMRSKRYEKIGD
jgi:ABC-type cobalamin/Fe3+-siderophores transport system ATPase subunit